MITKNCGSCHKEQYSSYQDTYHGQVNRLGFTFTAQCFDCHGSHDIKRVSDPDSTVFPTNRLKTCQQCHTRRDQRLPHLRTARQHAQFRALSAYWLAGKFMLILLAGVFSFFWTHSALWFYRELRDRRQRKNRPHVKLAGPPNGDASRKFTSTAGR